MATNNDLLRYIVRQNDLILRQQGMVLDLAGFQLERTFDMADDLDTVVEDVSAQTDIQAATAIVIDHAVSTMDDTAAKLKKALDDLANTPGIDLTKLKAIHDTLTTNSQNLSAKKDELAEAVTRNTPFDPSAQ